MWDGKWPLELATVKHWHHFWLHLHFIVHMTQSESEVFNSENIWRVRLPRGHFVERDVSSFHMPVKSVKCFTKQNKEKEKVDAHFIAPDTHHHHHHPISSSNKHPPQHHQDRDDEAALPFTLFRVCSFKVYCCCRRGLQVHLKSHLNIQVKRFCSKANNSFSIKDTFAFFYIRI